MEPISHMIFSAAYETNQVTDKMIEKEEPIQQEIQKTNLNRDTYLPEEPQDSIGRYWLGKDENGNPKIYSDEVKQSKDTSGTEDEKKRSAEDVQKQSTNQKMQKCTVNTDKVDREIEKLKEKKTELEQKLRMETEESKKQKLERELSQVEQELRQKDNDAYKRQHAEYRFS